MVTPAYTTFPKCWAGLRQSQLTVTAHWRYQRTIFWFTLAFSIVFANVVRVICHSDFVVRLIFNAICDLQGSICQVWCESAFLPNLQADPGTVAWCLKVGHIMLGECSLPVCPASATSCLLPPLSLILSPTRRLFQYGYCRIRNFNL